MISCNARYTEAHHKNHFDFMEGRYSPELDPGGPFVWAAASFRLTLPQASVARWQQVASLRIAGKRSDELRCPIAKHKTN